MTKILLFIVAIVALTGCTSSVTNNQKQSQTVMMSKSTPRPSQPNATKESGSYVVYGASWCGPCKKAKNKLAVARLPYSYIDIEAEPSKVPAHIMAETRKGIPVVTYPDGAMDHGERLTRYGK